MSVDERPMVQHSFSNTKAGKALNRQPALVGYTSRTWMLVPLSLSIPASIATFFESGTESPVFSAVLQIAPAWVYGCLWLLVSATALITLRFGNAVTYQMTNVGMVTMSFLWGGSTVVAKFLDGVPVTSVALGLWGFVAGASLFATFMPYSVARPEPDKCGTKNE